MLILIADPAACPKEVFLHRVEEGLAGGVQRVILRGKGLAAGEILRLAQQILPPCREAAVPLSVSDRADVAGFLGVDLHLPEAGLPPPVARQLLGRDAVIGRSVHGAVAETAGLDYLLYGHVYATGSKPGLPPRGLQALREVVRSSAVPVVAIGGITPERALEAIEAGALGVAVLTGILSAEHPREAARAYREVVQRCGW